MVKVLIADDDKVMLDLLTTLLDLEGDQAITVTKPEEVAPTARQNLPDLILMDVHLSGGNALTTLEEIKNDTGLKLIPVLMTSGMDLQEKCLQMGADDFILKPFRPAELLTRIHTLIQEMKPA